MNIFDQEKVICDTYQKNVQLPNRPWSVTRDTIWLQYECKFLAPTSRRRSHMKASSLELKAVAPRPRVAKGNGRLLVLKSAKVSASSSSLMRSSTTVFFQWAIESSVLHQWPFPSQGRMKEFEHPSHWITMVHIKFTVCVRVTSSQSFNQHQTVSKFSWISMSRTLPTRSNPFLAWKHQNLGWKAAMQIHVSNHHVLNY